MGVSMFSSLAFVQLDNCIAYLEVNNLKLTKCPKPWKQDNYLYTTITILSQLRDNNKFNNEQYLIYIRLV